MSVHHQILAGLFQRRGELAPELLKRCANIVLDHVRAEPRSSDLSQVVSTEYRADAVVELRNRRDAVVGAVVVEIQLGRDRDKLLTWPLYVAALRAQLDCPVVLLVITRSLAIARWARRPIPLGHPGFQLTPVVIDFPQVPRILDPADATKLPQLAVLSAIAHLDVEVARTAIHAITVLPDDQEQLYWDVIMAGLPDHIRQQLEVHMEGYRYRSPFARKYFNAGVKKGSTEGRQAGLSEGRQAGLSEGLTVGREAGLRSAVIALAETKLGSLRAGEPAAIAALHDERALTALIGALGQAQTPRAARAVLKAAIRVSTHR